MPWEQGKPLDMERLRGSGWELLRAEVVVGYGGNICVTHLVGPNGVRRIHSRRI